MRLSSVRLHEFRWPEKRGRNSRAPARDDISLSRAFPPSWHDYARGPGIICCTSERPTRKICRNTGDQIVYVHGKADEATRKRRIPEKKAVGDFALLEHIVFLASLRSPREFRSNSRSFLSNYVICRRWLKNLFNSSSLLLLLSFCLWLLEKSTVLRFGNIVLRLI